MTTIHIADDGWQYAEVEFKSTISESRYNICSACHKTDEVMKLTLPETAYHRNGQLTTEYSEYWLCPPCRRKLVHALDWPEQTTKSDFDFREHRLKQLLEEWKPERTMTNDRSEHNL